MRFLLFLREPEAVFWIFIFPILLALGLGIAFRNRPADVLPIAATTPQLTQALARDIGLNAKTLDEAEGARQLSIGSIQLLVIQTPPGVTYKYDDTNPDARIARMLADRAVQAAAGRKDPVSAQNSLVHEAGSRYIDFVVPGLLGMNLMGSAIWGLGFSIVEARQKKLLKRKVASPMPRWQYLMAFLLSRLIMLAIEVVAFLGFAKFVFGVPFHGSLWELALLCILTSLAFSSLGLLIASRARTMWRPHRASRTSPCCQCGSSPASSSPPRASRRSFSPLFMRCRSPPPSTPFAATSCKECISISSSCR